MPSNVHCTLSLPELLAPIVEYLVKWNTLLQFFWEESVVPVGGRITVSDKPGFGTNIDTSKIETDEELSWEGGTNMAGSIQDKEEVEEAQ